MTWHRSCDQRPVTGCAFRVRWHQVAPRVVSLPATGRTWDEADRSPVNANRDALQAHRFFAQAPRFFEQKARRIVPDSTGRPSGNSAESARFSSLTAEHCSNDFGNEIKGRWRSQGDSMKPYASKGCYKVGPASVLMRSIAEVPLFRPVRQPHEDRRLGRLSSAHVSPVRPNLGSIRNEETKPAPERGREEWLRTRRASGGLRFRCPGSALVRLPDAGAQLRGSDRKGAEACRSDRGDECSGEDPRCRFSLGRRKYDQERCRHCKKCRQCVQA